MDTLFPLIWEQFGSPWLAVVLALGWLLHGTGLVGHIFGASQHRERVAERAEERETVDWRAFTKVLTDELRDVRTRHAADIAEYEQRIRGVGARADDARKDALRWRHLVGSMGSHLVIQRRALQRAGIEAPRFDWSRFIDEGGDPEEFQQIESDDHDSP